MTSDPHRNSRRVDRVGGVLLLYHHPPGPSAPTIKDHVDAFPKHSRFRVWPVNVAEGFPRGLTSLEFDAMILHYSLFGIAPYPIDSYFLRYIDSSRAYKVAFFQDEYHYCRERFSFIQRYRVDCVNTLVEPRYWDATYRRNTSVRRLLHSIPGYVSDDLIDLADDLHVPDPQRTIDVGYRGRTLPPYMGKGAQEKAHIGSEFARRAAGLGLRLDIAIDEDSRIYGRAWFRFLADCRAVLGVEAGVSIFDLDDSVRTAYDELLRAEPDVGVAEIHRRILAPYEGNIYYRTVSPRHFEAAALRVTQILFEGAYSGVLEPMRHYIPLAKDFSNFDEVIARFRDEPLRRELTENARGDLIDSGRYGYGRLVADVDAVLLEEGLQPQVDESRYVTITATIRRDALRRKATSRVSDMISRPFPGRRLLRPLLKPLRAGVRRWRYRRWERRLPADDVT